MQNFRLNNGLYNIKYGGTLMEICFQRENVIFFYQFNTLLNEYDKLVH